MWATQWSSRLLHAATSLWLLCWTDLRPELLQELPSSRHIISRLLWRTTMSASQLADQSSTTCTLLTTYRRLLACPGSQRPPEAVNMQLLLPQGLLKALTDGGSWGEAG